MTKREAAIIEMHTDYSMLNGEDRKYIVEYSASLLKRLLYTNILEPDVKGKVYTAYRKLIQDDFIELSKNATEVTVNTTTETAADTTIDTAKDPSVFNSKKGKNMYKWWEAKPEGKERLWKE